MKRAKPAAKSGWPLAALDDGKFLSVLKSADRLTITKSSQIPAFPDSNY
jgi:hypothetical protein